METSIFRKWEAVMVSAIGKDWLNGSGVLGVVGGAVRKAAKPRAGHVDDLPEDMRRDIGLPSSDGSERLRSPLDLEIAERMRSGSL
ncbi:hypothetical protein [Peteryoungia ipomoeae]|uniref:Uncharacterized protein n=1 Tax=Peteryoungia ipomoeae TaxID=1210932 RepID=A0A4S8PA57_9HYPH|nr:hypothetical protein [Peteryoungia ipomoeae]THV24739.1 hypothetical protein FAA97_00550 [Peteryoungia ipomoeae]